ncbi:MAG TPA: sigma-70 family RNA polymerase sigma factor [Mycobacteriales bacterium]|nr:sigma-70 family RNA polymerase sigma factor [Mycobacteriales bacterium]
MSTQPLYDRESFDEAWPALAEHLRRSLTARGVPAQDRDDVVQETALRVYRSWTGLDPNRPAWPFVITVAINIWRDIIRERTGRIAQVHPTEHIEVTADLDVERDVLARQELAKTVVAMRSLAPEQRRLLLATEEFTDTVRPLRPAERVARMRVRRQLARAVGRATAAFALLWLRRPGRSTGAVATAYAGALAAAVLTSPAMVTMPAISALPAPHVATHAVHHTAPAAAAHRHVTTAHQAVAPAAAVTAPRSAGTGGSSHAPSWTPTAPAVHTKVCAPAKPPVNAVRVVVKVGSAGVYGADGSGGWQLIAATPKIVARSATGCVAVG